MNPAQRVIWLRGPLDGDVNKGMVSYLAGHDYTTAVPITANPLTNGARFALNGLFDSPCSSVEGGPNMTFTKAAPMNQLGTQITFTLSYANAGPGFASNVVVTDALPMGTTFVSATNGGMFANGTVTWNIGLVPAGAMGTLSFDVTAPGNGKYQNTANLTYKVGVTSTVIPSNTTITTIGPPDTDNDGISDDDEKKLGTNPNDADSDDDGVIDGNEPSFGSDSDGDGLINALDPDSDNDGLLDGTELGLDCGNPATDKSKGNCVPDADKGTTKTDPLKKDTDGGSVSDGIEDTNKNGQIDQGETDPNNPADDVPPKDTDKDGISDDVETANGSNPNDADSDDDGLLDGQEPNTFLDSDGDGLPNVLDPDSDNDGLWDGTEMGKDCSNPDTNPKNKNCIPDADPKTTTGPLAADTDGGGVTDGSEDANLDGKLDAGEGDPTAGHGDDDNKIVDSDKDGLSDALEKTLGSNPTDADSDDDGLLDGEEPNPADDGDGDGLKTVLDADSDNDALFDGTEAGKDCSNPATDAAKKSCKPDADPMTKTFVLVADSDGGGASDGAEDCNLDGKIDMGETNPNAPIDDGMVSDKDMDGLGDCEEGTIGTNPDDGDSDDDGVPDGKEPNPSQDFDGDGKKNALDPDSDDDGLFDGTELGFDCGANGTNAAAGNCIPDADGGKTTTSPLDPDTDDGGVPDGAEDLNHNGAIDPGEPDPNDPADDMGGSSGASGSGSSGAGGLDGFPVGNTLQGGGCGCRVPGARDDAEAPLAVVIAAVAAALVRARRRRTSGRRPRANARCAPSAPADRSR
jgi:uncharacterized repeat protein (TIGR01451 family)